MYHDPNAYLVKEVGDSLSHTSVIPTSVHKHEASKEAELPKCKVGRHNSLATLETSKTDTNIGILNHSDIVGAITNRKGHDTKASLDHANNSRLLSGTDTAAKNRLAILAEEQEFLLELLVENDAQ